MNLRDVLERKWHQLGMNWGFRQDPVVKQFCEGLRDGAELPDVEIAAIRGKKPRIEEYGRYARARYKLQNLSGKRVLECSVRIERGGEDGGVKVIEEGFFRAAKSDFDPPREFFLIWPPQRR